MNTLPNEEPFCAFRIYQQECYFLCQKLSQTDHIGQLYNERSGVNSKHPVNMSCQRNPEYPKKTNDCLQIIISHLHHEYQTSIDTLYLEMKYTRYQLYTSKSYYTDLDENIDEPFGHCVRKIYSFMDTWHFLANVLKWKHNIRNTVQ